MFDTAQTVEDAAIGLRVAERGTGLTQFGGHPHLLAQTDWPHDSAGRPMHHLLQLDCAALPFVDPDMPRTGTLMFFITGSYEERSAPDLSDNDAGAFAVIYQEEAPASVPAVPHPETCPALGESSYALEPVRYEIKQKKAGFLQRLVNTQPKKYSGSGGTGYFAAVPLEAVVFDSFPTSDAKAVFDTFRAHDDETAMRHGLRPFQLLGYAPKSEDLIEAYAQGHMLCGDEKALFAYEQGLEQEDILLAQFAHSPALNLDLVGPDYALQFRISRADLKARAFERTRASCEEHGLDGVRWAPDVADQAYVPAAEEMLPQIALKSLTPFEKPRAPNNYFCGAPQLPAGMDWPCMSEGYPLGFLMQVDCASLPRAAGAGTAHLDLPQFPEKGTLFIFAYDYLDEMDTESFRVLYTAEDTSDLPERAPPEALQQRPEYTPYSIKTRAREGKAPRPEPKRPFDPVAFTTIAPPAYGADDFEEKQAFVEKFGGAFPHEEKAVPEVTLLIDWLPNFRSMYFGADRRFRTIKVAAPVRNIPQSYPWRWGDISTATEHFPQDKYGDVAPARRDAVFGADRIAQGEMWKQKAAAFDPLARISQDDRAAYRTWLLDMDACLGRIPPMPKNESDAGYRLRMELQYAFEGIMERLAKPYETVLHGHLPDTLHYLAFDENADDLPTEMREVVAEMVRFGRSDTQLRGNQTYHRPFNDLMFASDDETAASPGDVMLFALGSGIGLPVQWGDCCTLQVWIEAEDLAAAQFDRIRPVIKW